MKRDKWDGKASDLVRLAAGSCVICGRSDVRLECMHIFGRRHANTRWDTDNLLCGCHACHRTMTENPVEFTAWLMDHFGEGYMEILWEKRRQIKKWKKAEKDELYEHLKAELARVQELRDQGVEGPISIISYQ